MQSTIKDIKNRQAASVTEPLTPTEAKEWCIVTHSYDDTLITRLIRVARMQVEKKTGLSLVERTITLTVELHGDFKLPHGPIRSITGIERRDGYYDDDPDWTTITDEDYRFDGEDYKTLKIPRCGTYRIVYVAGFTDENGAFAIGEDLKSAVSAQVAFLYENRGDNNAAGKFSEIAIKLLAGYIDYAHV